MTANMNRNSFSSDTNILEVTDSYTTGEETKTTKLCGLKNV